MSDRKRRLPAGVNLVGYTGAMSGVGEAARIVGAVLRAANIPFSVTANPNTSSPLIPLRVDAESPLQFDTNLVCVNADQVGAFAAGTGHEFFDGRPSIGFWHWETDIFPTVWAESARFFTELWMPSEHAASAVASLVDRPVRVFPLPVEPQESIPETTKASLGLPENYTFLFAFDYLSIFDRKNPLGVIEAFKRAQHRLGDSTLVIKTINAERFPEQSARLTAAARECPGVHLIQRQMGPDEYRALATVCDAYVSLHRAEGYGLSIAEAMANGKPVITTAYSGNLEFATPQTSILIPYERVSIGKGHEPYEPEGYWAEPNLDMAARAIRMLIDHPEVGVRLGASASEHMAANHSVEARAQTMIDYLERARRTSLTAPPLRRAPSRLRRALTAGLARTSRTTRRRPDG